MSERRAGTAPEIHGHAVARLEDDRLVGFACQRAPERHLIRCRVVVLGNRRIAIDRDGRVRRMGGGGYVSRIIPPRHPGRVVSWRDPVVPAPVFDALREVSASMRPAVALIAPINSSRQWSILGEAVSYLTRSRPRLRTSLD